MIVVYGSLKLFVPELVCLQKVMLIADWVGCLNFFAGKPEL
jgi:hypothetical protein